MEIYLARTRSLVILRECGAAQLLPPARGHYRRRQTPRGRQNLQVRCPGKPTHHLVDGHPSPEIGTLPRSGNREQPYRPWYAGRGRPGKNTLRNCLAASIGSDVASLPSRRSSKHSFRCSTVSGSTAGIPTGKAKGKSVMPSGQGSAQDARRPPW